MIITKVDLKKGYMVSTSYTIPEYMPFFLLCNWQTKYTEKLKIAKESTHKFRWLINCVNYPRSRERTISLEGMLPNI